MYMLYMLLQQTMTLQQADEEVTVVSDCTVAYAGLRVFGRKKVE
jgi:hypothetical protein